mmetsp:Transcript_33694/g.88251  ORF Transcript_33694/g.88251 Transcript_33694/m.88251 type:complete len:214 (+) Transcript_33694:72-713(+)
MSSKSAFICWMDTLKSPTEVSFCSMDTVRVSISLLCAAISASCSLMAAASVSAAAFNDFANSSPSCLSMPVISPLWGAYDAPPERKDTRISLSSSPMTSDFSTILRKAAADERAWRKLPAIPFSTDATAAEICDKYPSSSALVSAKALASFSRIDSAEAIATLASARSFCAPFRACWVWTSFSSDPLMLASSSGAALPAASTRDSSSPTPVLQ